MTIFKPALLYFLLVFGAGFIPGPIRLFLVVPQLGTRWAELLEMPVMLTVIYFAAGNMNRRFPGGTAWRLGFGLLALGLLLVAELAVAVFFGSRSIRGAFLDRDPVSGAAYYGSLVLFALTPGLRG